MNEVIVAIGRSFRTNGSGGQKIGTWIEAGWLHIDLALEKRGEQKTYRPDIIDESMVGGTGFEPVTSTV